MTERVHLCAYCIICHEGIYTSRVSEVHCLWTDAGWHGEPVCNKCYELLKVKVPKKLDVPIKRCNGKDCYICPHLTKQSNKNNICEAKHVNMGKSVYYELKKRGLEIWL